MNNRFFKKVYLFCGLFLGCLVQGLFSVPGEAEVKVTNEIVKSLFFNKAGLATRLSVSFGTRAVSQAFLKASAVNNKVTLTKPELKAEKVMLSKMTEKQKESYAWLCEAYLYLSKNIDFDIEVDEADKICDSKFSTDDLLQVLVQARDLALVKDSFSYNSLKKFFVIEFGQSEMLALPVYNPVDWGLITFGSFLCLIPFIPLIPMLIPFLTNKMCRPRIETSFTDAVSLEELYKGWGLDSELSKSIKNFETQVTNWLKNPNDKRSKTKMLIGKPGLGKTLFAKSFARHLEVNAYYGLNCGTGGNEFHRSKQKDIETALNPVQAFVADKKNRGKKCLLFLDEVDNASKDRSADVFSRTRDADTVTPAFMLILDNLVLDASNNGIKLIILGATNVPDAIDEGVKSRFGVLGIQFNLPDRSGYEYIATSILQDKFNQTNLSNCCKEFIEKITLAAVTAVNERMDARVFTDACNAYVQELDYTMPQDIGENLC